MSDNTDTNPVTTKEDKKARRARLVAERKAAEALASGETKAPGDANANGSGQQRAPNKPQSQQKRDSNKQNQPRGGKKQATPARPEPSVKLNSFHPVPSAISHLHVALEDRGPLVDHSSWPLLHSAFQNFLVSEAQGVYSDANALVGGFAQALCDFIGEYQPTTENPLKNELIDILSSQASLLLTFRPMTVGEANIFSYVRNLLTTVPVSLSNDDLKSILLSPKGIPAFTEKRVSVSDAVQSFVSTGAGTVKAGNTERSLYIAPNSTVLTYGFDKTIANTLIRLYNSTKTDSSSFHVVVLDARPHLSGQRTLKHLTKAKVPVTYAPIASLSALLFNIQSPAVAILPSFGVSASGSATSTSGSAIVATFCNANHIPVYLVSETYKYSSKKSALETSGLTSNQLAPIADLLTTHDTMLPRDRSAHVPSTQTARKDRTALSAPTFTSIGALDPLLDETVIGDRTRTPAAPRPDRAAGGKAQNPLTSNPDAALEDVPYMDHSRNLVADEVTKGHRKKDTSTTNDSAPAPVKDDDVSGVTSSSDTVIRSLKTNSFVGVMSHPTLHVGALLYDVVPAHTITKYICEFGVLSFDSFVLAAEQMQSLHI